MGAGDIGRGPDGGSLRRCGPTRCEDDNPNPHKTNILGRGRLLRIKPVLASGYIAALGYLGVLVTRWV